MKPTAQIVTPIIGQEIINSIHITSGLFNILITNGINNIYNIYILSYLLIILSIILIYASYIHYYIYTPKLYWYNNVNSILNHHLTTVFGVG